MHSSSPCISWRRFATAGRAAPAHPSVQRRRRCAASTDRRAAAAVAAGADAGEALRDWLRRLPGGVWDDCGLAVVGDRGSGFHAEALSPVRVPRAAIITGADARRRLPAPPPGAATAELSDWQALCALLLRETALGASSELAPYLAMLPAEADARLWHPLLWPEDVARVLLGGSPMLATLLARRATCEEDAAELRACGLLPGASAGGGDAASVRFAAACLLSRAFSLDLADDDGGGGGGEQLALVPWADSLNHSSEAGHDSCLRYDARKRVATLRAHRGYAAGEQVFDSYGPLRSPAELFLDYGFVDAAAAAHRADVPAAELGPVAAPANAALLRCAGLPPEASTASFLPDGPGEAVLTWMRAACASAEELERAGWRDPAPAGGAAQRAAYRAMSAFADPVSRENERRAADALLRVCEERERLGAAAGSGASAEAALARAGACGEAARRAVASEMLCWRGSAEALRERLGGLDTTGARASPPAEGGAPLMPQLRPRRGSSARRQPRAGGSG